MIFRSLNSAGSRPSHGAQDAQRDFLPVFVSESYDRRVDILLRLKSGEELLASQKLRNHKAEEGITTPFRITLPVDESKLLAAYEVEAPPILELTLTVRDDS